MAIILHIDTATTVGSVCLSNGEEILGTMENTEQKDHAATVTLFVQQLLREHHIAPGQLDAVAVSAGPGSYTGLRVGVATAKGLCYTWDKPLIGISTLQMMAAGMQQALKTEDVYLAPMIDARRMEVFTAVYNSRLEVISAPQALILDEASYQPFLAEKNVYFFGDGADKWKPVHPNAHFPNYHMSASHMVPLALKAFTAKDFKDVAYFSPDYLKAFFTPPKK